MRQPTRVATAHQVLLARAVLLVYRLLRVHLLLSVHRLLPMHPVLRSLPRLLELLVPLVCPEHLWLLWGRTAVQEMGQRKGLVSTAQVEMGLRG